MSDSKNSWAQTTLSVNGKPVGSGRPIVLVRGATNNITLKAPANVFESIMLEKVEAGNLVVEATPSFQTPVHSDNGEFSWQLKTGEGLSGAMTLVFYSHQAELPNPRTCWVMSANVTDEIALVRVDDFPYPDFQSTGIRYGATLHVNWLRIQIKPGSPLFAEKLVLTRGASGTDKPGPAPSFEPPLGNSCVAENGVYAWKMTFDKDTSLDSTLNIANHMSDSGFSLRCRAWSMPWP